jgi:glycosyltransferase involved in cell wall biosynthesis
VSATARAPRKTVIAAVYPLASGAAHFNAAMVSAMARSGDVDVISWRRMYPPLVYRGQRTDASPPRGDVPAAAFVLDWHDPRTWRRAIRRLAAFESDALVLPWLHPVMTLPYRYFLRHAPASMTRVVICHNVAPHERFPGVGRLTQAVLRHADVLVTHAPHQREELASIGLGAMPVLEGFHPRFDTTTIAPEPSEQERLLERARHGDPDLLLLTFGSIRPYKGVDIALDALALVDPSLRVRLVVAGRSWGSGQALRDHAARLGLEGRVVFRDGYVSDDETALLFGAADASLLPYRSASQSGVVQLSFGYGRPVIATRVGGLPAAVQDGVDGILCEPEPASVAAAIERMAIEHTQLAAGVRAGALDHSFDRYCALVDEVVASRRT